MSLSAYAGEDNVLPEWAFGGFERPEGVNPLITPNHESIFACPMTGENVKWEFADTFNPAAVVKDGKICILYRAEDNPNAGIGGRTSRIGLAETSDGITIKSRRSTPVMYPDQSEMSKTYEWKGGTEDPRVVRADIDGKTIYVMTYTGWNNRTPRLCIATSEDLLTWTHNGPAFLDALDGKYKDLACKSGSIVTEVKDGVQRAAKVKVNGEEKYLMYWGEEYVAAATSDDLVHWTPYVNSNRDLIHLIDTRKGYFDSNLTECGPPAIITDKGILLFYNGKNRNGNDGDVNYPGNTYAAGQVLFSLENPYEVIGRLDKPFFRPMEDFEKTGQYAAGTVFIEGLVYFKDKWYLYYGCADSMVGVAVYDPANRTGMGDPVKLPLPERLLNNYPAGGNGKLRCVVKASSGAANNDESAFYLNTSYSDPNKKWCDNKNINPWVVFEFTDYYKIDRFVFRDVAGRESNCGNVPEYWIYTSLTGEDNDWHELVHKTDVASVGTKDDSFEPVEVRYVKLVIKRGVRPNGNDDSATRIYGVDIYGEFSRPVDRGYVVSIGKTVLKSYDSTNEREQAINLLAGNYTDKTRKWCFFKADINSDPYKFAVIDLEDDYKISGFKMFDCKNLEPDDNVTHYQIAVSSEAPDLDKITPQGDTNSCWQVVVDKADGASRNTKQDMLDNPVTARYVKLTVPRTSDEMNAHTSRIYAFDVMGQKAISGVADIAAEGSQIVVPAVMTAGEIVNFSVSDCVVNLYTVAGALVDSAASANGTYTVPAVAHGLYIISVTAPEGTANAKVTIRS